MVCRIDAADMQVCIPVQRCLHIHAYHVNEMRIDHLPDTLGIVPVRFNSNQQPLFVGELREMPERIKLVKRLAPGENNATYEEGVFFDL